MAEFVAAAEDRVLRHLVDNRVAFSVSYAIAEKPVRLAYKEGSLPKRPPSDDRPASPAA